MEGDFYGVCEPELLQRKRKKRKGVYIEFILSFFLKLFFRLLASAQNYLSHLIVKD